MSRWNDKNDGTTILVYAYREAAILVGMWAVITASASLFYSTELSFVASFVENVERGSTVPNVCMAYGMFSGIMLSSDKLAQSYIKLRHVLPFMYVALFLCLSYYISTSKIFNFVFFGAQIADYVLLYGLLFSFAFFALRPLIVFMGLRSKSEDDAQ